jgi:ETC complex I subunit conserved region
MVWGSTGEQHLPAPVLPENPAEIAVLDPVDQGHRTMMSGRQRTVVIRQEKKSMRQAPLNPESSWRIYFYEDGMTSEKWTNSLMGWTSNADPYQLGPPLTFANASDAVYFVKKRGWNYIVKQPILRYLRRDDAQYQDNFLPIAVAEKISREGITCNEWQWSSCMTSHYFRPLKYHGNGLVRQHGPDMEVPIAPHVPGQYKLR